MSVAALSSTSTAVAFAFGFGFLLLDKGLQYIFSLRVAPSFSAQNGALNGWAPERPHQSLAYEPPRVQITSTVTRDSYVYEPHLRPSKCTSSCRARNNESVNSHAASLPSAYKKSSYQASIQS